MGRIRQPVAYGFYPSTKAALEESIQACFLDAQGFGTVPEVNPKRLGSVVAGVSPHAGFIYSGPVASHIYGKVAEDGLPETFVLIGPKHGYMRFDGAAIMTSGTWSTPLGECPIDESLAKAILECGQASRQPSILDSEADHQQEHSLEVQLPFIQFLNRRQSVHFVPLVISTPNYSTCKYVGQAIAAGIHQTKRDVIILASTDFTHYGAQFYHYAPVGSGPIDKIVKWVYETDGNLIRRIESLASEDLLNTVVDNKLTMCGSSAVSSMLVASNELGAKSGRLLKYATSYDIRGGTDAIVGYAAIALLR